MKRYRRKQGLDDAQFNQVVSDKAFAIGFIFMAITALLLIIISTKTITKIPEYEALKATVTWDTCLKGERSPGESRADVDTWIMLNTTNNQGSSTRDILGYSTPDRKTRYFILDQDDKGFSGYKGKSNQSKQPELNKEVIKATTQELVDGKYFINLHLYNHKGELDKMGAICSNVQVVIFKGLKGKELIVCDLKASNKTEAKLIKHRQELSVCQFEIRNGQFVQGSNQNLVQRPFIKSRPIVRQPGF